MKNILKKVLVTFFLGVCFFVVGTKQSSAESCSAKYGVDYQCYNSNAIVASKAGACKSDVVCPTSNSKCCPASAVSFSSPSGNVQPPCENGYFCKNTIGVPASSLSQCRTAPCVTETYINGRCCPLPTNVPIVAATPSDIIPGTTEAGGVIQCGRAGQRMCTLCDLIKGMNDIIKYLMRIAVGVALAAITIGGGIYIVSVGDPKMIETAKGAMKYAAIGLVVIFSAWLIINTLLVSLGTFPGLGIGGASSWGDFQCAASAQR